MIFKQIVIERSFRRKWMINIRIQIYGQQSAAIVSTERNFTTRIGRNSFKTQIGITIGNRFTYNRVPEKHSRFSRLPGIVDNFFPQRMSINFFFEPRIIIIDRKLLSISFLCQSSLHKIIMNFHRNIGTSNFSCFQFCINKRFRIGMFNGNREHQSTTATILRYFACRIGITLHERHNSCGSKRRIFHRRTFGSNM